MSELERKRKGGKLLSSWLWGVILFAALLLIDMLTKIAANAYFSRPNAPEKIDVIPGWIHLCITYNRGIAYGIGNESPAWLKIAVIVATGVLMAALAVVYFKLDKTHTLARVALVGIVAGGVGNFIDRMYYRVWDPATFPYGVRDMVDLNRFGFAVCNFADFFITGGAVLLVLALLFFDVDAVFPVGKFKKLAQEKQAQEEVEKEGADEANG